MHVCCRSECITPLLCPRSAILTSSSKYICTPLLVLYHLEREQILFYKLSAENPQNKIASSHQLQHLQMRCVQLCSSCVFTFSLRCAVSLKKLSVRVNANAPKGPGPFWSAIRVSGAALCGDWNVPCVPLLLFSPSSTSPRPTPGTLARSHHKLLADFSHIVTCWFVNSDKCNQCTA